MSLLNFFSWIGKEAQVLTGDKAKHKQYSNKQVYASTEQAQKAFEVSKKKLFDINRWSDMKGINSTFTLYDQAGRPTSGDPRPGYFIKIELPGAKIENWVYIYKISNEDDSAEFIVHPSEKPQDRSDPNAEVKHFFAKEASSIFRVVRSNNVIEAFEIGRNEYINNQGDQSGNRQVLNTLIAEGGWAGFQKIQWDKLTKYLVHSDEVKTSTRQ